MSDLSYVKAVILGAVQGLTEFLPVSSSAHLVLAQKQLSLDPSSKTILLFDMLTHVGTLIAMAIVFGGALIRYLKRLASETSPGFSGSRLAWKFMLLGIAATIPTGIIGVMFKDAFEASFDRPVQTGIELIITGVLLAVTVRLPRGKKGWREFGFLHAIVIGVAQSIAIFPGISRSGATICTATYCGVRRRWAADFSFFIATPAILGATVLMLKDAFELPKAELAGLPWGPMIAGSVVSMLVGAWALWLLLKLVRRSRLHWFAPYCVLVGALAMSGFFSQPWSLFSAIP